MRFLLIVALFVAASPEDDARLIRGDWRCTSLTIDGERADADVVKHVRLRLDRDVYREEALGNELQKLEYQLLPDGIIRFEARGTWFLGRYELDGRQLRLCYPGPISDDGRPRPPERFGAGQGVTLATWERE